MLAQNRKEQALSGLFTCFPATLHLAHPAPPALLETGGASIQQFVPIFQGNKFSDDWGCNITLQDRNVTGDEVRADVADPATKQVAPKAGTAARTAV